jgi:hypothetical protein
MDYRGAHVEKGYISYSGYRKYNEDKQGYFEHYVLGIPVQETKPMLYGKIFSEAFRDRKFDFVSELKKGGFSEKEISYMADALKRMPDIGKKNCEVELKVPNEGLKLYGIFDGYQPEFFHVIENKTGKVAWTKERVDDDEQLDMYALIHLKKFGFVPRMITLNWLNTSNGALKTFSTKRTVHRVRQFEKRLNYIIKCILAEKWD